MEESTSQAFEETIEDKSGLWSVLEAELNEEVPCYLKNIVRLAHLEHPLSFRCINDETIGELERFARKGMLYQLVGVEAKLEDYYGPFHRTPSKFRFAIGDRLLLKQLVLWARGKSDEFWQRARLGAAEAPRPCRPDSELDDDEDEPKERCESPLDLDKERRRLADMVRGALLKEDYAEGVDPQQVAARLKVRVSLKSVEEHGQQRDLLTGFVKCVFCPTRLMIRKQAFGTRKPRWLISNYRRHIRFHLDGKLKRPDARDFGDEHLCKSEIFLAPDAPDAPDDEAHLAREADA